MKSSHLLWTLLLIACSNCALSYKILIVDPMPARSHYNLGKAVGDILVERGHEITFINSFPSEKSRFREIGVPELMQTKDEKPMTFNSSSQSPFSMIFMVNQFISPILDKTLSNKNVQKLMKDKTEKFDLVIIDYIMNEVFMGFGVKYDCPMVILSTLSMMHWLARDSGNPIAPATNPNAILPFSSDMNFKERVINSVMAVVLELIGCFILHPTQAEFYQKYFPEEAAKVNYYDLKKKIALVLVNSHPSLGTARPLLPNAVDIGGYHIGDIKPLPEDFQKILDNAKNGAIFFSMGSNLKSSDMPKDVRAAILKSLGKLKQVVLWKFEEDLPGRPKNVIIRDWMPQTSILAHPNVKLFISHGGLLSTTETASAGVPQLSIPIFADQHQNAKAAERRGNGLVLNFDNITEESFTWAINEMLTNNKYEKEAKKIYALFNDRPVHPRELVAFYCEHVIKTGGAEHLSPPRLHLISSLLLDVALVLLLPPLLLIWLSCWLCRRFCGRNKNIPKQKKNEKQKTN